MMLIRRQKLQQRKMASGWVGERERKIARWGLRWERTLIKIETEIRLIAAAAEG